METVKEILGDRGVVYGDYAGGTKLRADILDGITARHLLVTGKSMSTEDRVKIFDIVNKLVRLSTSPKHKDTWLDIAGYATLTKETLDEV